jgi:hypothetical protein
MLKTLLVHLRKTNPRLFAAIAVLIAMFILDQHKTSNRAYFLLIDTLLIAYVSVDLAYTLKTGRADLRWSGTATREHQPKKYWRYVHELYLGIGLFVAIFVWAVFN